jgi:hypothetical protein
VLVDDDDILHHGVTFIVCCREWGSLEILQCICATNWLPDIACVSSW